jgi:hypothetical protein
MCLRLIAMFVFLVDFQYPKWDGTFTYVPCEPLTKLPELQSEAVQIHL